MAYGIFQNMDEFNRFLHKIEDPEKIVHIAKLYMRLMKDPQSSEESIMQFLDQLYSNDWQIFSKFDLSVVELMPSFSKFNQSIPKGTSVAFEAALQNIPTVVEEQLSWEQVLQFRKDPESRRKYRALKSWLKDGLTATNLDEAKEIIEKRLDDYSWTVRKHGLKTITGGLTVILDSKTLGSIIATMGAATLLNNTTLAAIASGFILLSKVSVWVAERMVDLEDIKRGPNSEIALIYETKRLVKDR